MAFNRVILGGTGVPGEVWSVNLSYTGLSLVESFEDLQQWAENIASNMLVIVINQLDLFLSNVGTLDTVRCEFRSGPEDELVQAAEAAVSPPLTGSSTPNKTPQVSAVVSILTGRPGRSYRGRIYWPAWFWSAGTTPMRFSDANVAAALQDFVDLNFMIHAQAAFVDPVFALELCVHSRLLGLNTVATSAAIGNVPDVQRRRRDDLVEIYQFEDIV